MTLHYQPFMGIMGPNKDGFSFCLPVWPLPLVRVCGAITANVALSLGLAGEICLPDKKLTVSLVPAANLIIRASIHVDIVVARGGIEAEGHLLTISTPPEIFLKLGDGVDVGANLWMIKPKSKVCINAWVDVYKPRRWLPFPVGWKMRRVKTWHIACIEFGKYKKELLLTLGSGDGDTTSPTAGTIGLLQLDSDGSQRDFSASGPTLGTDCPEGTSQLADGCAQAGRTQPLFENRVGSPRRLPRWTIHPA